MAPFGGCFVVVFVDSVVIIIALSQLIVFVLMATTVAGAVFALPALVVLVAQSPTRKRLEYYERNQLIRLATVVIS